ncbi:hypothetical protein DFP93_106103 [Aneurinibacillus soli]|uniref:Uncharacterized protein n=1 Tax=Aneurinibacillus soli TaxID=1500254 RepID=A0A0U5BND8_9BACL|nr:hypothetical protein DFP93_106103 [Aneurinibacillus soli]BAU29726.1 hypothetical protein CB4_03963 [Aneurinibacillus soli]
MNVRIKDWLELTMSERVWILIQISEMQERKRGL